MTYLPEARRLSISPHPRREQIQIVFFWMFVIEANAFTPHKDHQRKNVCFIFIKCSFPYASQASSRPTAMKDSYYN